MHRPRIAYVHTSTYFGSTEQSYVQPLLTGLDGWETWLVTPDAAELEPLHALADGSVRLRPHANALSRIRAYAAALRRIDPDLVHCTDVDAVSLLAARLAGVRRVVVTYHTPEHRPRDSRAGAALRALAWRTRPRVIFTSELDRETGLRNEPIARVRTSVIALPVDLERFDPAKVPHVEHDGRVVGTVGLLKEQKGHRQLIAAAREIVREEPDVRFVVVGDGALRAELERLAADLPFSFLGLRDDVPELVAAFDVFALSSMFEGMCLAVAEALALEVPVVATAVGGVPQTVVDRKTGLLVPPGDVRALADGILWTLRNRDAAQRMAVAGRERVARLYAPERMPAETAALYARLLGG